MENTQRRRLSGIRKYPFLLLMLLPGLLYFIVFHYIPMYGIVISFQDYYPFMGIKKMFVNANWVGLTHFRNFINSYYFLRLIRNTLVIRILKLGLGMFCAITLALLINELRNVRFKKIVQTISYLPHFLSWVIIAGMMHSMLASSGPVNILLKMLGKTETVQFLNSKTLFWPLLIVSHLWQSVGWSTIIYLAAITGVNPELYDSAYIDGANRFHCVWHITLPSILDIIVIVLIMSIGSLLNAGFEQILMLYSPGVYEVGDVISTYVYREGLINGNYSYGAAVGLFQNFIGLILIIIANGISKKLGQTGIW